MECPFCAEEINDKAKKCKHCGEFLTGSKKAKKSKKEVFIILNLLVIIFISYECATAKVSPEKSNPNPVSSSIYSLFEIEKHEGIAGIKKTYLIRLKKEVSKDTLKKIAEILTANERTEYKNIFITYLLPGMKEGHGAWATTHYTPELNVDIIGFNKDNQVQ